MHSYGASGLPSFLLLSLSPSEFPVNGMKMKNWNEPSGVFRFLDDPMLEGWESVFDATTTSELLRNSKSSWSGSCEVRLLATVELVSDWTQTYYCHHDQQIANLVHSITQYGNALLEVCQIFTGPIAEKHHHHHHHHIIRIYINLVSTITNTEYH